MSDNIGKTASEISRAAHGDDTHARSMVMGGNGLAVLERVAKDGRSTLWRNPGGEMTVLREGERVLQ